jgi:transcriptional antiterminator RfaH
MGNHFFGSEPAWYVLYTKAKEEDRAEFNLSAWQVETFTPRLIERRYDRLTGKQQNIIKHLFPRYIFARFRADQMLHKVSFTRGVHSVVSFGGAPAVVEDDIIETLRARLGEDGYVRLDDELRPGDKVVIRDGPLKNFVGVFQRRTKDQARISILLTAVSYQSHVLIERGMATKVAV